MSSARTRGRHGLAELQASPLVAQQADGEQQGQEGEQLRMKAISYEAVADSRPAKRQSPAGWPLLPYQALLPLLQDRAARRTDAVIRPSRQPGLRRDVQPDSDTSTSRSWRWQPTRCADACATGVLLAIPANRRTRRRRRD